MKTDVIKDALESVKKEDPKLYEDVLEYILPIEIKPVHILTWCIMNIGGLIL